MSLPARRTLTRAEMVAAYRTTRAINVILREQKLTQLLFPLLAGVADVSDASMIAIARAVGVTAAQVTAVVDRLEAQGLVARVARRSADGLADRRQVRVDLTDRGCDLLASLATIEVEW